MSYYSIFWERQCCASLGSFVLLTRLNCCTKISRDKIKMGPQNGPGIFGLKIMINYKDGSSTILTNYNDIVVTDKIYDIKVVNNIIWFGFSLMCSKSLVLSFSLKFVFTMFCYVFFIESGYVHPNNSILWYFSSFRSPQIERDRYLSLAIWSSLFIKFLLNYRIKTKSSQGAALSVKKQSGASSETKLWNGLNLNMHPH